MWSTDQKYRSLKQTMGRDMVANSQAKQWEHLRGAPAYKTVCLREQKRICDVEGRSFNKARNVRKFRVLSVFRAFPPGIRWLFYFILVSGEAIIHTCIRTNASY